MMRHLTKFALAGVLVVFLLAGSAEACHKNKCGTCTATVTCAPAPVVCARPAPCPRPVKTACAPRVKKCGGGGLFAGLCHKKTCAPAPCVTTGSYAYNYTSVVPSGQYYGAPQASGQHYGTPQATGQSYGTPQVPSKR